MSPAFPRSQPRKLSGLPLEEFYSSAGGFKGVSPGMLPPLGIIFGLFVAFVAAQVWADVDRAKAAVNRDADALSKVVFLAASFP